MRHDLFRSAVIPTHPPSSYTLAKTTIPPKAVFEIHGVCWNGRILLALDTHSPLLLFEARRLDLIQKSKTTPAYPLGDHDVYVTYRTSS